ncbi:MAG TPA: glycosyltransferase [Xanthobacteraceae bacterium]|nr:glycosyltransferase [Xanthobacteraceae bacterium]
MRILHTEASKGWGGQEIRILDEAEGMIARGWDVLIATPAEAALFEAAKRRGIPVHAIALDRRTPASLHSLYSLMREFRPHIVVSHSSSDSWLAAVATRFHRRPAVVRLRHLSGPVAAGPLNRWLYGRVPARVVTTSTAINAMLIERLSLDPAKVVAIPTGIDVDRFTPGDRAAARATLGLPANAKLVGIVATLRSWKGHRFLVEAMTDPRLKDARLILVGDGPQEPALRAQVAELGLDKRANFAGRQDDVVPWLRALDVFVLPSTDSEGVPQALMQAMACGVPVVTTAAGGIPELVRDGENGLVVPTENPSALAESIDRLLQDRALASRIASAGRREVEAHHTKAAMLDAMERVYRAAVLKSYWPVVGKIARAVKPRTILDLPSGDGWLVDVMNGVDNVAIDGIDLYKASPKGYRQFLIADLEAGVPEDLGIYDMVVSCEGIEHIANPGLLLKSAKQHLNASGTFVVSTPNTWYPASRLQYFTRGFFPGFPSLAGKIKPGSHMHIMPWSFPHLYLHLRLAGFEGVELHPCLEGRTHIFEYLLALPMKAYCKRKARKAATPEEKHYWETCASPGSLYARRLVVSAKKAG